MTDDLFNKSDSQDLNNLNFSQEILEKNNNISSKNIEKNIAKKIAKMSFEEAILRLDKIVETLSSQKNNLEEMIQLYEEATILKEHCDKRLSDAKMKIENINKKNKED